MFSHLAGLPRKIAELIGGILLLHAIDEVARLLETISSAALTGIGLRASVLRVLGVAHVFFGFLQAIDGFLHARISGGADAAGVSAPAGLPGSGLAGGRLPLAGRIGGLLTLVRTGRLLLGRIAALKLLKLTAQFLGLAPQDLLFP